jgi:hypothetical protein
MVPANCTQLKKALLNSSYPAAFINDYLPKLTLTYLKIGFCV